MTDKRPLLRAIFDAAVAAAHPDVILSAHLPAPPKGRIICLAAGKGAAAMAAAARCLALRLRRAARDLAAWAAMSKLDTARKRSEGRSCSGILIEPGDVDMA